MKKHTTLHKIILHAIYWGIGTPVCLFFGLLIFIITQCIVSFLEFYSPKSWEIIREGLMIGLSCAAIMGVMVAAFLAWVYAGLELGYLKESKE